MKTLFLDESGDHNLSVIDPKYPVFVLGGVIIDDLYADWTLAPAMDRFKRDLFGRTDIILHTADITRNRNGFEKLRDAAFRARFYDGLNALVRDLRFTVVACAIRKDQHLDRYGAAAFDPYLLSLNVLVERFCMDVGYVARGGAIVAERRGHPLDGELQLAWSKLRQEGTRFTAACDVGRRIAGLDLRPKSDNIPGLQLADLVVTPIGRHVIGKAAHQDWSIVHAKFRRSPNGKMEGYGLVTLPK